MGPFVGDLSTGSQKYGLFARFFHGAQCPAGGGVEQVENMKNMRFIVFYKCHGTPNGNKTKKEIKRDDFNSTALLEALARQFIKGVGENDVRPRPIQTRPMGGTGRG